MKRILSTLLIFVLLISAVPISLTASAATNGTTGDCTWTLNGTELTISGNGAMGNYYSSTLPWGKNITSVVIENGVTTIGDLVFNGCDSLTSVIIPDSVTTIGEYAFAYCDSLTSVTIPDSVITIGSSAFDGCDSLTSITIPDSVVSIGAYAFCACENLTSVTIGDSVITIDEGAFEGCENLAAVYISDVATWCNIQFGSGESNPLIHAGNLYLNGDLVSNLAIPDGVTTIGPSAFRYCSSLTSVTIPDSVTTIGKYAFWYCSSLTSVTIPNSVTTIGENTFSSCDSLTSVTIGNSVTSIGSCTFDDCDSLTSITIPDSVTTIGSSAFSSCDSLTSITIPDSVTTIGSYAFYACISLTSVTIPDSVTSIGVDAFANCNSLTSITIPDSVTTIGSCTFYDCDSLTSITIPDSVTTIGSSAFSSCDSLTSITIPDSVTTIGSCTFYDCDSLTSITIPNSVITIGDSAFEDCTILTSVTIPDSVTSIGWGAFSSCDSLTSITIPDSVTTIGEDAFYGCGSLKKVALPTSVTTVEGGAFAYSGVKVVYIPKEITLIKNGAFDETEINYVYYGGSEADKENLIILPNNDSLNSATWVYNATGLPECEYDNACDTDCNICEAEREITHNYQSAYNAAGHFEECTICGDIGFGEPHAFDNDCDTNCDCGYVRKVTHSYGQYVYNNDATTQKDGTKTRTCSVCGEKQTVTAEGTKIQTNPFKDVKKSDFYYTPVLWAVENGITSGTSKTTFAPNEACTRGQIATFLWRAAGCPNPKTSKNPFTDVKKSDYYYKAVLWAVGEGITSGATKTNFQPDAPCTRGQIATFLWRSAGAPTSKTSKNPFTDVKKKDYYYKAVLWAVGEGITAGTTKTTFGPNEACTRGQIATFLYRAYN